MVRVHQFVLILSVIVGSWLGMQAIHELGHVLGATISGGRVAQVVLHPLTISRTDLALNPHPLFVVWAGPLVGVLLPLLIWGVVAALRFSFAFVLRFFAGFCLIANGLYIGIGSFDGVGDCGQMLRHGSPMWHLWLFGMVATLAGFWIWHRLGGDFGLGMAKGRVSIGAAYLSFAICIALLALSLAIGGE
ncbi:MAG: hypothetical protein L0Y72_25580 [Gemmataceae bacterium]|nr:hypothetical protein [Gemmataceae bacterium]MCI0742418.1 hypothetical protein [Gemmataceae bacterium]